jgi:hypothetical protein
MLWRMIGEAPKSLEQALQLICRGHVAMRLKTVPEAALPKLFTRIIHRFGHAIAEDHDRVIWMKLHRAFVEDGIFEGTEDQPPFV